MKRKAPSLVRRTFLAPPGTPAHTALQLVTPDTVKSLRAWTYSWLTPVRRWIADGYGAASVGEFADRSGVIPDMTREIVVPNPASLARPIRVAVFCQPLYLPGVSMPWIGAKCGRYQGDDLNTFGDNGIVFHPNVLAHVRDLLAPTRFPKWPSLPAYRLLSGYLAHELTHAFFGPKEGVDEGWADKMLAGLGSEADSRRYVNSPYEVVAFANQARFEVMHARLYTPPPYRPTLRDAIRHSPHARVLRKFCSPPVWEAVVAHIKRA